MVKGTIIERDFVVDVEYGFGIIDIEEKVKNLVDRAFNETGEYRYFWVNKVYQDKYYAVHFDFEFYEDCGNGDLQFIHYFLGEIVGLAYDEIIYSDED